MKLHKRPKAMEKLNLIPIMDAVFIFIFFLLMSSQFIKIYEIGTEAPKTSIVKEETKEKPLNLILEIKKDLLIVKKGIPEEIVRKIERTGITFNEADLVGTLAYYREKFPKEKRIILRPEQSVPYEDIITIIDKIRYKVDRSNATARSDTLFSEIIFDSNS